MRCEECNMQPALDCGGWAWGRDVLQEGVRDLKVCVPKMAQQDFPNGKFRFFPLWSL